MTCQDRRIARRDWMGPALVFLWLLGIFLGGVKLLNYSAASGTTGAVPATWPAESGLTPPTESSRLLVFLHPHCPCSKATVSNLERLVAQTSGKLLVRAVVVVPTDAPQGWEQTPLVQSLYRMPGVAVKFDFGGVEAKRFGAQTSGHVLLYAPPGRLVFNGGITPARGHEGDCRGIDAIAKFALEGAAEYCSTEVFGCPLQQSVNSSGQERCTSCPN